MLAMPISPTNLFMAAKSAHVGVRPWDALEKLAKAGNVAQCFHADRAVCGRV